MEYMESVNHGVPREADARVDMQPEIYPSKGSTVSCARNQQVC
jgi:hypothetical protein